MSQVDTALGGLRVLVTRPARQSQVLCRMLEEAGAQALAMPLLEIHPPRVPAEAVATLAAARACDWAFFTSANAVHGGMRLAPDAMQWPHRLAAIGPATAHALREWGFSGPVLTPDAGFTSESLLAEPALQDLRGATLLLVRGEGGRRHLADTLAARGAHIREAVVYRRQAAHIPPHRVRKMLEYPDVVILTSAASLSHLVELADGACVQAMLRNRQLVVPSERVLKRATEWGFLKRPWVTASVSNNGIVDTLVAHSAAASGADDNQTDQTS